MAKIDPAVRDHLEWIGFVQPTGLVVSAPALVRAGAILDRRDTAGQELLRGCVEERIFEPKDGEVPWLPDFRVFAEQVLGWGFSPKGYAGTAEAPIPEELEVTLPVYGETLRPDFAVRELDAPEGGVPWQLLVRVLEPGEDFDRSTRGKGGLEASAHGRMERLLRRTGVTAGLLFNGRALRLLSAPSGESSGWLDFQVADMVQTAGRSILAAMRLLLIQTRLLAMPKAKRLAALLDDSRKFQNEVSERLAEQVLHALYELLRGFQAAHDASKGKLLHEALKEHPDEVYRAMLTVILRLVFLFYAEERDMLPEDETFLRYYSLAGLYERLREDAALYPDTMDQRYGAWAQLVVLFRLIHDGADCGGAMHLPRRHGVLFDPDRYPFLENRRGVLQRADRIEPPLVPDGTIYCALEKLLVLDGERISYRALDVEQIGSVYETMMGFRLETATGRSAAIKAAKKHGAPATLDLEALLEEPPAKRRKWIQDRSDRKITARVQKAVKAAATLEDLHAALDPVLDKDATPDLVPQGAMVLQPSEERRKSGSHYTPRQLTEPIVRTTLEPILARLRGEDGRPPRPEEILDLKVCDPAMGSGAFLVEACRQLGKALEEAWHYHDELPEIPPDEREEIFAMRLVAQRCLYGVDRNPVAVDLSKVSLWLVTLAKEHALTFVDHALRHGDSLVGLSRRQLEAFHWDETQPPILKGLGLRDSLDKVRELRERIRLAGEEVADWELRDLWDKARFELGKVRLIGDLAVAAFFEGSKPKEREAKRVEYAGSVLSGEAEKYRAKLEERRYTEPPLTPYHWQIEFPEVFERDKPGFDAFTGNPPFMGGVKISGSQSRSFLSYLLMEFPETGGQADLVAYFFRQAFRLLRPGGCLGLIATKTIAQGDTRRAGLAWIARNGGKIYTAKRQLPWPGNAAVIVSEVFLSKGTVQPPFFLDGKSTDRITAYLLHMGRSDDPAKLAANRGKAFKGYEPYGEGFLFADGNAKATPVSVAQSLLSTDESSAGAILPYYNGKDIASVTMQRPRRYAIFFGDRPLNEVKSQWPQLVAILEDKVRPYRLSRAENVARWPWWQFWRSRPELRAAIGDLEEVLATPETASRFLFALFPSRVLLNKNSVVFALPKKAFPLLQCRVHENWVQLTSSTLKNDQAYRPSDCFETFPFPEDWEARPSLEAAGKKYFDFRAALMVRNNEGLTKTYNRFHDPEERDPDIEKLRELHAAMDRAVLDAYGWNNIPTDCEFLLDYEIDEEEWSPRRKKPWRYRWPDEVRDEVLARLLELNAERAKEEIRTGAAAAKKRGKKKAKRQPEGPVSGDLFS